ncbi:hypothetical protein BJ508DRAFT_324088 [Ascobolus immersus RN42]|uniref:Uncharacterized protein n=1 Tax=Ascobolus immersus RN42 TaxID=1160509 RepID=A0A3N4ID97_ASCIM|nr:hypothetical protein BJ508DRAFT_324088 [Ascobolus immersus RN42]
METAAPDPYQITLREGDSEREAASQRRFDRHRASEPNLLKYNLTPEDANEILRNQTHELEKMVKKLYKEIDQKSREVMAMTKLKDDAEREERAAKKALTEKEEELKLKEEELDEKSEEVEDLNRQIEAVDRGYAICGAPAVFRSSTEYVARHLQGYGILPSWKMGHVQRQEFLTRWENTLNNRIGTFNTETGTHTLIGGLSVMRHIYENKFKEWSEKIHAGVDLCDPRHYAAVRHALRACEPEPELKGYLIDLFGRGIEFRDRTVRLELDIVSPPGSGGAFDV